MTHTATGATLAAGGTRVMQEMFEPRYALALVERERVPEPHVFAHQARALEAHPDWIMRGPTLIEHHVKRTGYKVSKSVLFFTEDETPMNGSGTKVQHEQLLAVVQKRLSQ